MFTRGPGHRTLCPQDERYPDFEIYLICFNCTNCSAELWIRTDPENKDCRVEEDDGFLFDDD
ncbi:hypothetical protein RGQ29_017459 [Quercus rubra]|uniref:Uncharacterized protein n=1 Tax=Quercus rubra TaxID=3512 RepID=A0AAN7FMG1_QUERU|nr:hypothetical protein RGQ29_017459 [Quercus rubra]